MKVGDLVAFSAYGANLDSLSVWGRRRRWAKEKPLVGMVIKIASREAGDYYLYSENESVHYFIKWFGGDGPKGRDGRYGKNYFYRKDLKFVSKGKSK